MSSAALAMLAPESKSTATKTSSKVLRVSEPGDAHEREADQVADIVVAGGRVPHWSLAASGAGLIQRDTDTAGSLPAQRPVRMIGDSQDPPTASNYGDMLAKLAEAFLKTEAGKAITNYIEDRPIVKAAKDFVETPAGVLVAGSTAIAAISGLAAAGKGLPAQLPAIPLDKLIPGLSVKIDVEGPLNHPTQGSLMFTFGAAPPKKKKGGPTESEKYRAETARMAQAMKFGAGVDPGRLGPAPAADAQQRQAEAKAVESFELRRMGAILQPGATYKPGQFTPLVPGTQPKSLRMRDDASISDAASTPSAAKNDPSKKEEIPVQRKAENALDALPDAASEVESVISSSSGRPLDRQTRSTMESRIGFDFSKVRIHTDARAAASAKSVGARAYTVGNNIVFSSGRYVPYNTEGRRLLAHELVHVVQQSQAISLPQSRPAPMAQPFDKPAATLSPPFPISRSGERWLGRDPDPNVGSTTPPQRVRIVRLDNNVIAEIGRGNAAIASALRSLTRNPNVKVQMSRGVYIETTRVTGDMLAVRKALIEKLHIEVVDESIGARAQTYDRYAGSSDFPTHGGPKTTGGERLTLEDLPHIASAKAGGPNVELWSMDARVQTNATRLGVKVAPESSIPILKNVPDSAANVVKLFPEIKPPSGGGGGGGSSGGSSSPPPEEGGGGSAGGAKSSRTAAVSIGSLPEGTATLPENQTQAVARGRAIAQLEQETAESVRLTGRVGVYLSVFGAVMQAYTAFSTITDAQTMLAEGTLFGDAQRQAESLHKRSASDLSEIESMLDKISLLDMLTQLSDALIRRDSSALFDISGSIADFGMSLLTLRDHFTDMAAQLEQRSKALEVMKNYFEKMAQLPTDPMAGTLPQAQAFTVYQSVDKMIGPVNDSARNYRSATDQLSFYSDYTLSLAHQGNSAAWALILRRLAQAQAAAKATQDANAAEAKKMTGPDSGNAHPTHPASKPRGFPNIEEQQRKQPCPNCHSSNNDSTRAKSLKDDSFFKSMSDEDMANLAKSFSNIK